MEKSSSQSLGRLKKIRRISLIAWTIIAIVMFLMIQYASVHVQWQRTVTMIIRVFIVASLAQIGYDYHLNKKIRDLKQNESSDQ